MPRRMNRTAGAGLALAALALLVALPSQLQAEDGSASPSNVVKHELPSPHFSAAKPLLVYLPPEFSAEPEQPYPVLYFLHGLGNSPEDFVSRGAAELTDRLIADGRVPPLVVALPSGALSYYVNRHDGGAPYEDLVRLDAPAFVEANYPVRRDPGGRAFSGISMGGFGALKIAMRYPGEFASASAHTPFLMKDVPQGEGTDRSSRMFMRIMRTLYGDPIDAQLWHSNNPFALAVDREPGAPPILFTGASKDRFGLHLPAAEFHRHLLELDYPHTYVPFNGVHGWKSFAAHWEALLQFHARFWTETPSPLAFD